MTEKRPRVDIFAGKADKKAVAVFGSLKNGAPAFSTDPDEIQSANYSEGWEGAVIADNNPMLEDFNAQGYVLSAALKYLYRHGVAAYHSEEVYAAGSFVNENGRLYVSLTDNNQGNPLDNINFWQLYGDQYEAYPIGSFFTQYPGQLPPTWLYPHLKWHDITASYAGSFFRAEGAGTLPFEEGLQSESLPDISGDIVGVLGLDSGSGCFGKSVYNKVHTADNSTSQYWRTSNLRMNASLSNAAYGRRDEVAPQNESIRLWRRVGTVSDEATFYEYDVNGAYVQTLTLGIDEAGIIGYNPNRMTDTPPPDTKEKSVLSFSRAERRWEVKPAV
jgi:hypothetical protein